MALISVISQAWQFMWAQTTKHIRNVSPLSFIKQVIDILVKLSNVLFLIHNQSLRGCGRMRCKDGNKESWKDKKPFHLLLHYDIEHSLVNWAADYDRSNSGRRKFGINLKNKILTLILILIYTLPHSLSYLVLLQANLW